MLPQYEISGIIGRGGMGAVYRGRQAKLDRDVAIKLLPETLAQGDDELNFAARFEQEARAMAKLDHPSIISVFDFGETSDGQLYFVMEFIDGMDIHQYLQHHNGKLEQDEALSITAHVLDALEYAHRHGIVHRDIKPANVLLNHEGRVKIADFGLAKKLTVAGEDDSAPALTMTNMAIGTPDYVAPEALDSDQTPDHRADLYAVGVMLYKMLTGKLPRGNFELPSEMLAELDPRLDGVVSLALAPDPDNRYATASDLRLAIDPVITSPMSRVQMTEKEESDSKASALEEAEHSRALQASKIQLARQKQAKSKLHVGIGVGALVLIGGLVAFLMNSGEEKEESEISVAIVETPEEPPAGKREPESPVKVVEPETANRSEASPVEDTPPDLASTTTEMAAGSENVEKQLIPESAPVTSKPAVSVVETPPPAEPKETMMESPQSELASVPGLGQLLKSYLGARNDKVSELSRQYLGALNGKLNKAADAGNLKLAQAFEGERVWTEELQETLVSPSTDPFLAVGESTTLPPLAEGVPEDLVKLRIIWTTQREKIREELDTALQQSLRNLEVSLTKARDLDNAQQVLTYRESFGSATPTAKTTAVPAKNTEPDSSGKATTALTSATKDKPFENSLGMRFVPVPITGGPSDGEIVLFSIWETRVADYEAFIKTNRNREWPELDFKQDDDHPAVNVTWEDAVAFCEWLTEEDRKKGKLGKDEHYRLPTDHEWSCAVGIGKEEDEALLPDAKSGKIADIYPWGKKFPPPKGAGNYYGEETKGNPFDIREPIEGYDDGYDRTAPVGSFEVNEYGLYDMGGNVWECCQEWVSTKQVRRVLRGGSGLDSRLLLSSARFSTPPDRSIGFSGFRVVVAGVGGTAANPTKPDPEKPAAPKPLATSGNTAMSIASATKDKPFENSLGMRFVPVPITGGPSDGEIVLFSIWETRVKDYEAFIKENKDREWPDPDFRQKDDHPAVMTSWDDAQAFCAWLTEVDRMKGKLGQDEHYRLPTDHEWSCAVGIGREENSEENPLTKSNKITGIFPWGTEWPPPKKAGNFYGEEAKQNLSKTHKQIPMDGYDDGFDRTASVGSFEVNDFGLYDMSGNVWEHCEDTVVAKGKKKRVIRGGFWGDVSQDELRSSRRSSCVPEYFTNSIGFRVVVAGGGLEDSP
tara:strand:- start:124 stop:3600 length:3477 start_codon:yes stop_codon:yes gene_type:complete